MQDGFSLEHSVLLSDRMGKPGEQDCPGDGVEMIWGPKNPVQIRCSLK